MVDFCVKRKKIHLKVGFVSTVITDLFWISWWYFWISWWIFGFLHQEGTFHLEVGFVSRNWWHISTCSCPTDTESFQISSKLLGNTFYSSKYNSFKTFWPICFKPNRASQLHPPHYPKCKITAMYLFQKRTFTSYSFVSIYISGWFTKGRKGIVLRQCWREKWR